MNYPTALTNCRQWVCWRFNLTGDTPESRPYCPNNGLKANLKDPRTWGTLKEANDAMEKNSYAGVGYVFAEDDPYIGIEIEHCYDPESDTFSDIAQAIMRRQPTYTEFLPSGTGIHMIFAGKNRQKAARATMTKSGW